LGDTRRREWPTVHQEGETGSVDRPTTQRSAQRGYTAWSALFHTLLGGRSEEVTFADTVTVRLYERSNLLEKFMGGAIFVDDDPNNNGLAVFKISGTHYELEYRVVS
jgi:hypothetical protein